jgi:hypothetical protein
MKSHKQKDSFCIWLQYAAILYRYTDMYFINTIRMYRKASWPIKMHSLAAYCSHNVKKVVSNELIAPSWHLGCHLTLVMSKIKISEKACVWLPAAYQMIKQIYIDHTPCAQFTKRCFLLGPTTVFLLPAPSWHWEPHLSLAM